MRFFSRWHRGVQVLVLAALTVASVAPMAQADRGRRFKGVPSYYGYGGGFGGRVYHGGWGTRRVIFERRDSSPLVPAFAGFIGGLVVGSVISHSHDAAPPPPSYYRTEDRGYDYYDPTCDRHFSSLDACASYMRAHDADDPGYVRVIDRRTGECVHEYQYSDRGWVNAPNDQYGDPQGRYDDRDSRGGYDDRDRDDDD